MEKNLQYFIFSFLILTVFVIDINQASQNNVKDRPFKSIVSSFNSDSPPPWMTVLNPGGWWAGVNSHN